MVTKSLQFLDYSANGGTFTNSTRPLATFDVSLYRKLFETQTEYNVSLYSYQLITAPNQWAVKGWFSQLRALDVANFPNYTVEAMPQTTTSSSRLFFTIVIAAHFSI